MAQKWVHVLKTLVSMLAHIAPEELKYVGTLVCASTTTQHFARSGSFYHMAPTLRKIHRRENNRSCRSVYIFSADLMSTFKEIIAWIFRLLQASINVPSKVIRDFSKAELS
uniref:Tick transposon n=1 Tax=Rhipicephalus appendiculatus TaxID=34631 RepID=A0A131YF35_RHIAP